MAWNSWVKEIEPKPDVVFVAVGAHIKSDDASYLGLVDQVIREMQEMQEQYPNMKFAWKTQQPGELDNACCYMLLLDGPLRNVARGELVTVG